MKPSFLGNLLVGTFIQIVPIRPPNQAQVFSFNDTFTSADSALGKVVFKTVVTIVNAYPGDNEMWSIATKVTR